MTEQLRHRADTIKALIRQQPERGVELLLDFARLYGIDEEIENKILLGQYDLSTANTVAIDVATEGEGIQEEILTQLEVFADEIVGNYDADKVEARFKREKELTEAIKQKQIPNDVVLIAENIIKNYQSSKFKLQVEHLELRLGEVTGLVGENATGKSTLLNILAGELAQQSGTLHYPLFDPKNRLDWTDLKLRIAYVPQELPTWQGTLRENLTFEAARHGILGEENKQEVNYIIQRLGLALHIDKSWQELSGGFKLRFALAKALVWRTQLLILDEPLAFLDIKTQMIVLSDLRNLAKSFKHPLAILVSSQHLHEVESVADKMLFMRDGQLENLGNIKDFNRNRDYNLFEFSCSLSFTDFNKELSDLEYLKTWQNDNIYFISTPLSITGEKLMKFLSDKNIILSYYRDISNSVKTKFYEDAL